MTLTKELSLSLDRALVPLQVDIKQYDGMTRKIVCTLYEGDTEFTIPSGTIANISGLRRDGEVFQYTSELDADVVTVDSNAVSFYVTDFMTAMSGRVPIDVTLTDSAGNNLGSFGFILSVGKAAVESKGLNTGSYSAVYKKVTENVVDVSIDDDGYLVIESNDDFGLSFSMDGEGIITISF